MERQAQSPGLAVQDRLRAAVFLDRDGTINEQVGYIADFTHMKLLPRAAQAIARINELGYWCIVVTNQSAVARGLATGEQVDRVNAQVALEVAREAGGRIDGFYYCPHHPEEGDGPHTRDCDCRKPSPGMILQAAREFGIDIGSSWFVGDGLVDHQAAKAADPRIRTILLPSSYHEGEGLADFYESDLWLAVRRIEEEATARFS